MEKSVDIPIKEEDKKVEPKPIKKGPGRPRKQKPTTKVPRHGIVDKPHDPANKMELVYDNPNMWKKIFNIFKTLKVEKITMHFDKEELVIIANDGTSKQETETQIQNRIHIVIYGNKQNRYYCAEPFSIDLGYEDIEKYLSELCKEHSLICFISRHLDWRNKLMMLFKYEGEIISNTDQHTINVKNDNDGKENVNYKHIIESLANECEYNISFLLPFAYFKKIITNASCMTTEFKIQKNGDGPLQFMYVAKTLKSTKTTNFPRSKDIFLESNIEPEEVFSTSFYVSNVKPFARTSLTDFVRISVDYTRPVIFTCLLDASYNDEKKKIPREKTETARVKVITNIINYRK